MVSGLSKVMDIHTTVDAIGVLEKNLYHPIERTPSRTRRTYLGISVS
jgi:hypothetical protein